MNSFIHKLRAALITGLLAFAMLAVAPSAYGVAGALDAFNPVVVGTGVYTTAVQPDGKIIIGGQFTTVGGVTHTNIARLNADGSVDGSFTTSANNIVYSVVVQTDGKILLGGNFTQVNGVFRNRIARLNSDGTLESTATFDTGSGAGGTVSSVVVQPDGKIVVGGTFSQFNSIARFRIARLHANGSLESTATFNPGVGADALINSVALQADGKIVLGGNFTTMSGASRNRIARLNADGTLESTATFDPGTGADAVVNCVAVQPDGKILVGGQFTNINGTARNRLARLNADGSLESTATFNPGTGPNSFVYCVAVQTDGKIVLSGIFTAVNATTRNYVARLNGDGSLEGTGTFDAGSGANNHVYNVALQADGKILLSGFFGAVNGTSRSFVARLLNDAAPQTISAVDMTQALWSRGGSAPEVGQVSFELSTDGGTNWVPLGEGVRVGTTANWQRTGLSLPASGHLRARGRTTTGFYNGGSGLVETVGAFAVDSTLAPTLIAPATNAVTGSPVSVSFSLPETALAGSVKLSFGGTQLTLATSQESSGVHSFSLNPANPTASPEVAAGAAFSDGTYSVTLAYQDAVGNPAAQAVSTGVVVDTTTLAPTLTAPATNSVVGNPVNVSFSLPETALPGSVKLSFGGTQLTLATSQESSGVHSFSFDPANPTASPEVASGGAIVNGIYTVTLAYRDTLGNPAAQAQATNVEVAVPTNPVLTVLGSKGAVVAGAGVPLSGIAAGAQWVTFGVPSVNEAGQAAVLATYKVGAVSTTAILAWQLSDMAGTIRVVVAKGAAAPGIAGATMSAFKDPLLGPDGSVAYIATLAGVVTPADKTVIFLDADGAGAGSATVVARTGSVATGAAIWKSFTSVALGADAVAFAGMLESQTAGVPPGPGGVTTLTDSGLWMFKRGASTMTLALREGDALLGSTVKIIGALVARPGSPGQGRGVATDGTDDFVTLRVTLADNRQVLARVSQDGAVTTEYTAGDAAVGYGAGALWQSFGLPTQNAVSAAMAFVGTVKSGTGTATSANNMAIFAESDATNTPARVVAKGEAAVGVSGGIFSVLKDPVNGSNRSVAFVGVMKADIGAGISAANDNGIWRSDDTNGLSLVAREGAQPPGAPVGAQWSAFTSLALPEGGGPLFVATMLSNVAGVPPGPGGITTANDVGLWATDSAGTLRLLLQEGDTIGASTVKTFTVISVVAGSPAQTRSFNGSGSVVVRATDVLGAQHLLHIAVP